MKSDFPHNTCECCVVEMSTMRSPFEINLPVVVVAVVAAAAVAVDAVVILLVLVKQFNCVVQKSRLKLCDM